MASIEGLEFSKNFTLEDARGLFIKVQSISTLNEERQKVGSSISPKQVFFSESRKGVVRGLHLVPFSLTNIPSIRQVFMIRGKVRDFVLDCRPNSPSFGEVQVLELDRSAPSILIPQGCAHGFEVVSDVAIVGYLETSPYQLDLECGYNIFSVGIQLVTASPIISSRDLLLPPWTHS